MPRQDGKSRDAEMRRNDTHRNPAGTEAQRFQQSEAAGASSAEPRKSKGGAEQPLGAKRQQDSGKAAVAEREPLNPSRNNRAQDRITQEEEPTAQDEH